MQNFVYLIGDPSTHEAMIVDPGWEVDRIMKFLTADEYRPTKIFLSHAHFDHVNGVDEMLSAYDIPIYAQQTETQYLPEAWRKHVTGVSSGDTLMIGALESTVVHTPGHTPGSHCLLIDGKLVTGDTLFVGTCGRTDLPGGDPGELYETLTKVFAQMDDATMILPGHDYGVTTTTTLGHERAENPFFQFAAKDDFLRKIHPANIDN